MSYNSINTHIPQGTLLSSVIITELVPDTYPVVEKFANIKLASILSQYAKEYHGSMPRHLADFGTAERYHKDITGGVTDMHDRAVSFLMYQQILDENKDEDMSNISYSDNPYQRYSEYTRIFNFLKNLASEKLDYVSAKVKEKIKNSELPTKGLDTKLAKEFNKTIGWYVMFNYQSLARNSKFIESTGLGNFELIH